MGLFSTLSGLAVALSAVAAVSDLRTGQIPNWLTLPTLVIAPIAYGTAFGFAGLLRCVAAIGVSALVPYFLFRRSAMGGGDVKLFAALGGLTSFDLLGGLEIQLVAFLVALPWIVVTFAWEGTLFRRLARASVRLLGSFVPWIRAGVVVEPRSLRLGGAIFIATAIFAAPRLSLFGGGYFAP